MTGRIAMFVGPSLGPHQRPDHPAISWFPPAATGDILRVADQGFGCIGLIDGYFDHRPAPWHKELLVAIAAGIRLIGSSSMGALRAAELDRFGMEGVGAIYRAYRDNRLTGDDEVALIHGTEAIGWAAASVPLVEVRATLIAAVRQGLIDKVTARHLRAIAQDVHYAERDWPLLEKMFSEQGIVAVDTARAISRLHVPLKQLDAEQCVAAALEGGPAPPVIDVPETSFLRALRTEVKASQAPFP